MTIEEVKSKIDEIIKDTLYIDSLNYSYTPNSHLQDDFGADSLDAVDILVQIEKEFDISIQNDDTLDVEGSCTVQNIYDIVIKQMESEGKINKYEFKS